MKSTFALLAGVFVTLCSVWSFADGTNAVPKNGAAKSAKAAYTEVEGAYSNFIPAVSNLMGGKYGPGVTEMLGYVKTNTLASLTNSALPEMGQAGKFLVELKNGGRLPGVAKDSHGYMSADGPLSE